MSDAPRPRTLFESIVAARLQVLQSKRLLLASNERRFRVHHIDALRKRAEQLREELEEAQHVYRAALLKWGTPARPDYWPVAYGQLIELADDLAQRLRTARSTSDAAQGYELAVEVEVIEDLIDQWRSSLRLNMTPATA